MTNGRDLADIEVWYIPSSSEQFPKRERGPLVRRVRITQCKPFARHGCNEWQKLLRAKLDRYSLFVSDCCGGERSTIFFPCDGISRAHLVFSVSLPLFSLSPTLSRHTNAKMHCSFSGNVPLLPVRSTPFPLHTIPLPLTVHTYLRVFRSHSRASPQTPSPALPRLPQPRKPPRCSPGCEDSSSRRTSPTILSRPPFYPLEQRRCCWTLPGEEEKETHIFRQKERNGPNVQEGSHAVRWLLGYLAVRTGRLPLGVLVYFRGLLPKKGE